MPAVKRETPDSRRTVSRSKRVATSANRRVAVRGAGYQKLNRRGLARPEVGYIDINKAEAANNFNCNQAVVAANIVLVNPIPQGTSVNQRVGKKVLLKSFQMRGWTYGNDSHGVSDNFAMLIYDKRPTGVMPVIGDFIDTSIIGPVNAAMNNDSNSGRFVVLKRWNWSLCGNPGQGGIATGVGVPPSVNCWLNMTGNTSKTMDDYVDLKMRPTVYKAAGTGTIGDIEEGALYMICGGTGQDSTNVKLQVGLRTRFVDV